MGVCKQKEKLFYIVPPFVVYKIAYLEVVSFARDVGNHFLAVAQTNQHTLSVGRVGLLRLSYEAF